MTTGSALTGDLRTDACTLALAAALGLVGGLVESWVTHEPVDPPVSPLKSAVIGAIAAIGALWAELPATMLARAGQSLLAGYFGRAVLALLKGRVTAALERDKKARAVAVAEDALRIAEDTVPRRLASQEAGDAPHHELAALRARLLDIAAVRPTSNKETV